jgi:hypothetical protein
MRAAKSRLLRSSGFGCGHRRLPECGAGLRYASAATAAVALVDRDFALYPHGQRIVVWTLVAPRTGSTVLAVARAAQLDAMMGEGVE